MGAYDENMWKPDVEQAETVLEGEIVPYDPTEHFKGKGNYKGKRRNYNAYVDQDHVQEIIDARAAGESIRSIQARFPVSKDTIVRWCGEDLVNKQRADVPAMRAQAAQHLEAARRKAWKIFREAEDAQVRKLALEALRSVESLTTTHARLMGLNMPVRVDVQITELTEAERELQEMINEAKAQAALQEQAVIDAASKDPDL